MVVKPFPPGSSEKSFKEEWGGDDVEGLLKDLPGPLKEALKETPGWG